jgi:CrcB protein
MNARLNGLFNALWVIAGGGLGALLRYLSSRPVNTAPGEGFPLGTVFVNSLGSLLMGFLVHFLDPLPAAPRWKLFLLTGFLGAYTTFSAYALETAGYFLAGNLRQGLLSILLNNVLCLAFVAAGMWISRLISAG